MDNKGLNKSIYELLTEEPQYSTNKCGIEAALAVASARVKHLETLLNMNTKDTDYITISKKDYELYKNIYSEDSTGEMK